MKKRALYWILSIMLVLSLVGVAACKKDKGPKEPEVTPQVTLNLSETTISLFETTTLVATTNTDEEIVWTTSDSSVLSVEEGKVTPKKAGTANVTATAGELSASCAVTVTTPGGTVLVDVLSSFTLEQGSTLDLNPKAWYVDQAKHLDADGATYTYSVNGAAVSVNRNGVVSAVETGTATITVNGSYRGVAMTAATIEVTVINNLKLSMELQTATLELGGTENSTLTLEPVVKFNGADYDQAEITVVSADPTIVSVDGLVVTAVAAGTTKVTVTAKVGDLEKSVEVEITTVRNVVEIENEEEIIFEISDETTTTIDLAALEIEGEVLGVSLNGEEQGADAYTLSGTTLTVTEKAKHGEFMTVALRTATTEYRIPNVTIVTKVIENKADLDWVKDNASTLMVAYDLRKQKQNKNVYFIMTADVDYEYDETWANQLGIWGGGLHVALGGTFNGRGHSISHMVLKNGFIQGVGVSGVLENLAIVDTEFRGSGTGGALVNRSNHGMIRNMYLQGYMTVNTPNQYSHSGMWSNEIGGTVENVIINLYDRARASNSLAQTFCTWQEGWAFNTHVISDISEGWAVYDRAQGAAGNGVYFGIADFLNRVDVAAFVESAGDYWEILESGVPIFKSAKDKVSAEPPTSTEFDVKYYNIAKGDSKQYTTVAPAAGWKLAEAVEGVTIDENGVVTVDASVAEGTKFVVQAQRKGQIAGALVVAAEIEVTVVVDSYSLDNIDDVTLDATGGEGLTNSVELPVVLKKNDEAIEPAANTILYEGMNGVVEIDPATGVMTALKAGETTITVYYASNGTDYETFTSFDVTVKRVKAAYEGTAEIILDKSNPESLTVEGISGTIEMFKGESAAATPAAIASTACGELMAGTLYTTTHEYKVANAVVTIVDVHVTDAASWNKVGAMIASNPYVIVTESFDYEGDDTYAVSVEGKTFGGKIDGRGNNIDNLRLHHGIAHTFNGTLKNISFTNVKHGGNNSGTIACVVKDGAVFENIYVETDMSVGNGGVNYNGVFGQVGDTSTAAHITMKNVIVNVLHRNNGGDGTAVTHPAGWNIDRWSSWVDMENVFVIIDTGYNGYLYGKTEELRGGADQVFTSSDAYGAYAIENNLLAAMNGETGTYWTAMENGYVMFASASEAVETETAEITGGDSVGQGETGVYSAPGAVKWSVNTDVEGIEIDSETGVVTVAPTVAAETAFEVVAYYTDDRLGTITLATKEVTVEAVAERITIAPIAAQTLYLTVADGQPNEITLAPSIILNEQDASATISKALTASAEGIVAIDGMKITAIGLGEVTLTLTVTAPQGRQKTASFVVTVSKNVVAIENEEEWIVDLSKTATSQVPLAQMGITEDILEIKIDGGVQPTTAYTVEGGVLTVLSGASKCEMKTVTLETATKIYTIPNVTIVDIAISDVESLNQFFTSYRTWSPKSVSYAFYAIVTADIDASTWERTAANSTTGSDYWTGHLNGRGHTIANFDVSYSFIGNRLANGGSIKNLALVNVVKSADNTVGLLGNSLHTGTLENVYVKGTVTSPGVVKGALWYWHDANGVAQNVVADITVPEYFATHPAWAGQDSPQYYGTFSNLYVITNYNNGYLRGTNETCLQPGGAYTSMAAFLEAVDEAALVETLGEYWKLSNGAPIFKSAEAFLTAVAE